MPIKSKMDFKLRWGLLLPNLALCTAEGIIFFFFLLLLPKEPKNSLFLGYSSQRWLLLAGVLAITVLFSTFFVYFQHNSIKASQIDTWLLAQKDRIPSLLIGYFLLWMAVLAWLAYSRSGVLVILENTSSIVRLAPFWGWSLLIPFQLMCFWIYEWKWVPLTLPSYLAMAFFIGFLALGLSVYQDYGLAWDEPLQVNIGRANWSYIREHEPEFLTFQDRYFGPAYELILLRLTDSWDTRQMYLARHLFNFLFFSAGVAAFFWLAQRLFASSWVALLASLFLMLSPRIFADSFYNTKDIPFMVSFIFSMSSLVLFLDKPNWLAAVLHGSVSAFSIAIRVTGIFIPVITIVFLAAGLICQHKSGKIVRRDLLAGSIYLIALLGLTTLFWPILWHDPLGEFINALNRMANYPWIEDILFLGHFIKSNQLPWYYIPAWISISTPLLYVASFGLGVIIMLANLFRQPGNWFEGQKRNNLIILACFFGPLLAVMMLHSTFYNAWRQMFFIYPPLLLVAVQGIRSAIHFLGHRLQPLVMVPVLAISLAVGLGDPVLFAVRNHPYENLFFNRLAGENMAQIKQSFELDYWGLAFKQGIDYILLSDRGEKIPIYVTEPPGEYYIDYFLPANLRDRLILKDSSDQARYFIGNYASHPEEYPFQKKIYSVYLDGASILSVFDLRMEADNQSK